LPELTVKALKKVVSLFLLFSIITGKLFAQDTLPRFTIVERGDKITISWINPFPSLIQLNVQRSFDSLRYFSTVYSATSPELPQNGFTESRMPTNRIFYRIFYVVEGGQYYFTPARRVGGANPPSNTYARDIKNPNLLSTTVENRMVRVSIKDSFFTQLPIARFRSFRDSILRLTKDTLVAINDSLVLIRPYVAREVWRPSSYVYANNEGFINVSLPLVQQRSYHIKFFEENGNFLFEIKHLRESPIIVDKSNFIHAGWFLFELYEDDKLKEKNKFYLPKDF
jgi:hypothetical protein